MERLFVIVATVLVTGTARAADFFEGADPSAEIVKERFTRERTERETRERIIKRPSAPLSPAEVGTPVVPPVAVPIGTPVAVPVPVPVPAQPVCTGGVVAGLGPDPRGLPVL